MSVHELGTSTVIVPVSSVSVTKSAGIAVAGLGRSVGAAAEAVWPATARAATDITVAIVSVVALVISILHSLRGLPRG